MLLILGLNVRPRDMVAMDARRPVVARRTFFAGVALAAASVLLVHATTAAIRRFDPAGHAFDWADRSRAEDILSVAIPAIARDRSETVVVLGSSRVLMNFYPRDFDAELATQGKHTTSYNLSFNALGPTSTRLLSRRLASALDDSGQRPRLTLVEFFPWVATRMTARWGFTETQDSVLATAAETVEELRRKPADTRILVNRYLRVFTTDEWLTWLSGKFFPGPTSPCMRWFYAYNSAAPDPALIDIANGLCPQLDAMDAPGWAAWNIADRGPMKLIYYPQMKDVGERFTRYKARPEIMQRSAQLFEDHCGVSEMDFDPAEVQEFIDAVRVLARVSQQTEIIMPPIFPDLVKVSPVGAARLAETLTRIEHETGVHIADFTRVDGIEPRDFMDPVHLNQIGGSQRWSRILARHYAPRL